jgi:hypothetical protein
VPVDKCSLAHNCSRGELEVDQQFFGVHNAAVCIDLQYAAQQGFQAVLRLKFKDISTFFRLVPGQQINFSGIITLHIFKRRLVVNDFAYVIACMPQHAACNLFFCTRGGRVDFLWLMTGIVTASPCDLFDFFKG